MTARRKPHREKRNPATQPSRRRVPASGEEDVVAGGAAARAFPAWSALPAAARAPVLMRAAKRDRKRASREWLWT